MTPEEFLRCETCNGTGAAGFIARVRCSSCDATGQRKFDEVTYVGRIRDVLVFVTEEENAFKHHKSYCKKEPWKRHGFWFSSHEELNPSKWNIWVGGARFAVVMGTLTLESLRKWAFIEK